MFPDLTFQLNYEWSSEEDEGTERSLDTLAQTSKQFIPSPVADLFLLAEPNKSLNKQTDHNLLLLFTVK